MNEASAVPLLALPIGIGSRTLGRKSPKATPTSTPKTPTSTSKIEPEEAGEVGEEKCAASTFQVSAALLDQVFDCSESRDPLGILRWINETIAAEIDKSVSWLPGTLTRLVQRITGLRFTSAHFDASCGEAGSFMLYLTSNRGDAWEPIRVRVTSETMHLRLRLETQPISETWAPWKRFQKLMINKYAGDGILLTHTNLRNLKKQVRLN